MDPKVDYVFKKLFASEENKPILLSALDAVLTPSLDQRLVAVDLLNPFNDKETWDDKVSVVDVKARDQRDRLYNVEMQMSASIAYPHRALYYWAVLYGQQLHEGMDYPTLKPMISISIVNDVLFPVTSVIRGSHKRADRAARPVGASTGSSSLLRLWSEWAVAPS